MREPSTEARASEPVRAARRPRARPKSFLAMAGDIGAGKTTAAKASTASPSTSRGIDVRRRPDRDECLDRVDEFLLLRK